MKFVITLIALLAISSLAHAEEDKPVTLGSVLDGVKNFFQNDSTSDTNVSKEGGVNPGELKQKTATKTQEKELDNEGCWKKQPQTAYTRATTYPSLNNDYPVQYRAHIPDRNDLSLQVERVVYGPSINSESAPADTLLGGAKLIECKQ